MTAFPIDETHERSLTSWVGSAQSHADFPIQNLPYGVFRRTNPTDTPRIGVAIGDEVLDLGESNSLLKVDRQTRAAIGAPRLNQLMALSLDQRRNLRHAISQLLRADAPGRDSAVLHQQADCEMLLPATIGDYTDFYASIHHATNVGQMLRPDNPLFPNYKYIPIGYHGRASSIVVSGTNVRRPQGQTRDDAAKPPVFGPTRRLDYELELGFFIGRGNELSHAVPVSQASGHLFGMCLLNDWSARDIQAWEYQPLGPFLAKNFASTISPWVVTLEALAPFRAPAFTRAEGDPSPLPYLHDSADQQSGAIDVALEVWLSSRAMREAGQEPVRLSRSRAADLYWTPAQFVAHHTSGGCNLNPGDLLGSGTVSGPTRDARGCLLELTWRGSEPVQLPTGEKRAFLEDGDEVILRAACERDGFARIGFGECRGIVVA